MSIYEPTDIKPGDQVFFTYEGTPMTGVVAEVLAMGSRNVPVLTIVRENDPKRYRKFAAHAQKVLPIV